MIKMASSGPYFEDYEKSLPQTVDTSSVVRRCWNQMKLSLRKCEPEDDASASGYHSLFFRFAHARDFSITESLKYSENDAVEFEKLLVRLEDQYFPLIFLFFERLKFYHRARGCKEKPLDYLCALEKLAETCEFREAKGDRLKDQFLLKGNLPSSLKQATKNSPTSKLQQVIEGFERSSDMHQKECHEKSYLKVKENQKKALLKTLNYVDNLQAGRRTSRRLASRAVRSFGKQKGNHLKRRSLSTGAQLQPFSSLSSKVKEVQQKIIKKNKNGSKQNNSHKKTSMIQTENNGKVKNDEDSEDTLYKSRGGRHSHIVDEDVELELNQDENISDRENDELPTKKDSEMHVTNRKDVAIKDVVSKLENRSMESPDMFVFHEDISENNKKSDNCLRSQKCNEMKSQDCECSMCAKHFDFPSRLSQHMCKHTGIKYVPKKRTGNPKPKGRHHEVYTCSECGAKLRGKRTFNNHMKQHNLYCDICSKVIDCKSTFKLHMDTHRGNKPHQCDQCSRSFTRKSDLKAHAQVHDPQREKKHICDVCGKDFYRIHELQRHHSLHTNNKPHVCDICNKGFPTAHGLKCHQLLHTGIKSYVCDKCGKAFASKSNLVTHLMRHTGVKDHVCTTCGTKFSRKCYLESHMRSHTKEKPYSCSICGACVASRYSLQRHNLIHTGAKPHECQLCHKTFKWQSTYKKHMESHGDPVIGTKSSTNETGSTVQQQNQTLPVETDIPFQQQIQSMNSDQVEGEQIHQNRSHITCQETEDTTLHQHSYLYQPVQVQEQALNLQCGQKVDGSDVFVSHLPVSLTSTHQTQLHPQGQQLQYQSHPAYEHHIQSQEGQVIAVHPDSISMDGVGFHHDQHQLALAEARVEEPRVYVIQIAPPNSDQMHV